MKKLILYIISVALLMGIACSSDNPVDNGEPEPEPLVNKVWIDFESDSLATGEKFAIDVYFENAEPLTGLVIPLSFEAQNISVDSISLIGSRFETFEHKGYELSNDEMNFQVYAYSTENEIIDSASGLGFTVYLWVWGNAPAQDFSFDSTFIAPATHLQFMNEAQQSFTPLFEARTFHIDGL